LIVVVSKDYLFVELFVEGGEK